MNENYSMTRHARLTMWVMLNHFIQTGKAHITEVLQELHGHDDKGVTRELFHLGLIERNASVFAGSESLVSVLLDGLASEFTGWSLTQAGKRWLLEARQPVGRAYEAVRLVFSFSEIQEYRSGRVARPSPVVFTPKAAKLRMDDEDYENAFHRLEFLQLVVRDPKQVLEQYREDNSGKWIWTSRGVQVLRSPELLEHLLASANPQAKNKDAPATVNFHGPTQIGHHNTQSVTCEIVVNQLIKHIRSNPQIPNKKKHEWVGVLEDILSSGLAKIVLASLGGR